MMKTNCEERYELVVQAEALFVFAVDVEERTLHLGKREPVAVVQLID